MDTESDHTTVKRSLAVTLSLMASIVTAIVGLTVLSNRPCRSPAEGGELPANLGLGETAPDPCRASSGGHGSGGNGGSTHGSNTRSATAFGGFGETGHSFGFGGHG